MKRWKRKIAGACMMFFKATTALVAYNNSDNLKVRQHYSK